MGYRVKTVSTMTGIPRATLLAWERRYAILDPERTNSGYREYSDADVSVLKRLKGLVDLGHPIGEAVSLARSAPAIVTVAPDASAEPLVERLLSALRNFDAEVAQRAAPELDQLSFQRALDQVYMPLLWRAGEEWAGGRMTIAQEHFLSAWCRERMIGMLHAIGNGPVDGPRIACATAPGEQHELGLLAVAVKLALSGWRVTWLGADLPISELARMARTVRPRAIAVSVMRTMEEAEVRSLASRLRSAVDPSIVVFLGGPAVRGLEASSTDDLVLVSTFGAAAGRLAALAEVK